MNKVSGLQEFLSTQSAEISVSGFLVNLVLAALLAYVIYRVYVRYGSALSNRRMFGRNFMLLSMTTMLIITIVKSSLALSLGLVGALSIVRFRAAIKEPEELAYLFLCIAVGLGLGADQRVIVLAGMPFLLGTIWLVSVSRTREENRSLHLVVSSRAPHKAALSDVVNTLQEHCEAVNLRRFDETDEALEASFQVEFRSFDELEAGRAALRGLGEQMNVTLLDSRALINVEQ